MKAHAMKINIFLSRLIASLFIFACLSMQVQSATASGMSTEDLLELAEGNSTMAQRILGERYAMGTDGVTRDMDQAVSWWQKAADKGDAQSQNYLGQAYSQGEGIAQDLVQAHMWFSLAETSNRKKTPAALQHKKEAENNRKAAEANMTPEQIKTAQALAQEWREKHNK